ncbi:MAG: hypothetical protein ACSHX9_14485 [Luteolibacter sp.]
MGVRSFANMYGYSPGQSVTGLQMRLIGLGKFVEKTPTCPGTGNYSYGTTFGADTVPPVGALYLECDLSTSENHIPVDYGDW